MANIRKLRAHVLVCKHKTCLKQGGKKAARALKRALKAHGLRDEVMVTNVKCLDQCGRGPVMAVYPDGVWYGSVDQECARAIVVEHLEKQRALEKNLLHRLGARDLEA